MPSGTDVPSEQTRVEEDEVVERPASPHVGRPLAPDGHQPVGRAQRVDAAEYRRLVTARRQVRADAPLALEQEHALVEPAREEKRTVQAPQIVGRDAGLEGLVEPPLLVEDRNGVDRIELDALSRHAIARRARRCARPTPSRSRRRRPHRDDRRRPSPSARTQAVTPEPHVVTMGRSSATPADWKACRSASGGRSVPSGLKSRSYGRLRLPGMCPPRRPGRGSGSVPAKRPAERASTTWAVRVSRFRRTAPRSVTSSGRKRAVNRRGAGRASPVSMGRPSSRHFGRPPSSTATRSCPNTRKVHQTRAEATRYLPAYTTIRSPSPTPRAPTASAKRASPGSMWGSP